MENNFVDNITNICEVLQKNRVKYLIVGGTAVALHGYFRWSSGPDGKPAEKQGIDFWYDATYDNYFKLLKALSELGLDTEEFENDTSPNPKNSFFKLEDDNFTLCFLPHLKSLVKFGTSFRNREIVKLDETEIWFINYDDLIADKLENGRDKDLADVAQLKVIKRQA